MSPLTRLPGVAGPFAITALSGDAGDDIRFNIPEDHRQDDHPNVMVFVRGRFHREQVDGVDGDREITFLPGDTNDKIGDRKRGLYRMCAIDDGAMYVCVSGAAQGFRPAHESVRGGELAVGQLAVQVNPPTGEVLYAETAPMPLEEGVVYEKFWRPQP